MKIICSFCKQEKEYYAKGFCRNCYARYNRRGTPEYYEHPTTSWYERNKEKASQNLKKWRLNNKEKYKEYCHNYHLENKEKIHSRQKKWYLKNRERILEKIHNNKFKSEVE
jgi:hypothetical protein